MRRVNRAGLGWFDAVRPQEWIVRQYLIRLLNLDAGGSDSAAGELRPLPHAPWPNSVARLTPYLRLSLAAHRAAARGDSFAALAVLDSAWLGIGYQESHLSPFYARPWDLYFKARLLQQLGRADEAERWYNALGTFAIADYVYRAPAQFERGRILEPLGRAAEARAAYGEVIELWGRADPEFQPVVRAARARLAGLRR